MKTLQMQYKAIIDGFILHFHQLIQLILKGLIAGHDT